MKKQPKISCVIPTFNRKFKTEKTIDSLLNQTFKEDYEIIVVDDGSQDDSYDYLKSKFKYNEKVKIFKQKNNGVSSARNKGLFYSEGEYICFIDSDDTALSNRLEDSYNKIKSEDLDFLHAKANFVNEAKNPISDEFFTNGKPNENNHWYKEWNKATKKDHTLEKLVNEDTNSPVHAQTVMVRKKILDDIKRYQNYIFDEHLDFVEDYDLWKRIALEIKRNNGKFGFLDEYVSNYEYGSGNSFSNKKRKVLGHEAIENKSETYSKLGSLPKVLFLAGTNKGSHKKTIEEISHGLFEEGITRQHVISQPNWFSKKPEYNTKKITNSMDNDVYENKSFFQENYSKFENLESALEDVNFNDVDVIHIIDNRWADQIEELKKYKKPIVYKISSLLKHEVDKDSSCKHFLNENFNDESILDKQEKLLKNCDRILVQTESYKKIIEKYYPEFSEKIRIVRNGPDFKEDEIEEIYNKRESNKFICNSRFLSVGRLDYVKGNHLTIEAFKHVIKKNPHAQLYVAGDSNNRDYVNKLKKMVEDYKLQNNVIFLGNKNKEELKELYKVSRGFIQSSLHEHCSISMLNAAHLGLTIIGPNIDEFKSMYNEDKKTALTSELIKNKDGFYEADPVDLASKINFVINNPGKAYEIGKNCKEKISKWGYNSKNVVDNIINVYGELI